MSEFSVEQIDGAGGVVKAASVLHISEYEVFRIAYRHWFGQPAPDDELRAIFDTYVDARTVPLWVRAYVRRVRKHWQAGKLDPREFGVEPNPPTSQWAAFWGGFAFAMMIVFLFLLVYLANEQGGAVLRGCQFPPCY